MEIQRLRPRPSKFDVVYGMPGAEPVSPVGTRYGTKMVAVFGPSGYLQALLDVEAASSLEIAELYPQKVPPSAARRIASVAKLEHVKRDVVERIEAEQTHHDVGAMTRELSNQAGDAGGYVHYTMTSADATETAKARQIYRGLEVLIETVEDVRNASFMAAKEWKDIPCIIRTHGQHAIPATFGLPFAFFGYVLDEHATRLYDDRRKYVRGKMSGAIGTYDVSTDEGMNGLEIEEHALRRLGIKPSEVSMQVPPRENIARIMTDLAILGGTLANISRYIKTLKRTEILELEEEPEEGAMGSSAMPNKDEYGNPHIEERAMSIAHVLRGFAVTAMETVEMEDFRDLTASLSDRIIIPEGFVLADYSGRLMENVIYRIDIIPESVERNLMMTHGVVTSQRVMSRLIPQGISRREARRMVGVDATKAFREARPYVEVLLENPAMLKFLSPDDIRALSNPHTYLGRSVEIIDRVSSKYEGRRTRRHS